MTEPIQKDVMKACVLRVCKQGLLVCDLCTLRELLIQTPNAAEFRPGDRIQIRHGETVEIVKAGCQPETNRMCRLHQS